RSPHTTVPNTGNVRRQSIPLMFRVPFSLSVRFTSSPVAPTSPVSVPAGAFHTPRAASVRAYTPATHPLGGNGRTRLSSFGSADRTHGKYSAELRATASDRTAAGGWVVSWSFFSVS